jgi:hypothetical protein
MGENWNSCIQRAKGYLIHILHDDDYVADGYYTEIEYLSQKYPDAGLYATRNVFVDDESIITAVSDRIRELEKPTKVIESFLYQTPIQCAAVTVRRAAYEAVGGFRPDMGFVIDCEMWARITGFHGAVVSTKVLAAYRIYGDTETHRVMRTAEGIKDICRLNELFAERYPSFSIDRGRARVSSMAWGQYLQFKRIGDDTGAAANYEMWKRLTPLGRRLSQRFDFHIMTHIRRARQLELHGALSRIGAKLSSWG